MDDRIPLRLYTTKRTENTIRWDVDIDGIPLELYIPKWRVPSPWPEIIYLTIKPIEGKSKAIKIVRPGDVLNNRAFKNKPIESIVEMDKELKNTLRYCPLGASDEWEIRQTYIHTV